MGDDKMKPVLSHTRLQLIPEITRELPKMPVYRHTAWELGYSKPLTTTRVRDTVIKDTKRDRRGTITVRPRFIQVMNVSSSVS